MPPVTCWGATTTSGTWNDNFTFSFLKIVRTMHHLCKHGNCLWKDRHKDGSVRRNFCRAFWGCRHLKIKMSVWMFMFRSSGFIFQEPFKNPTVVTDGRVVPTNAGGGNGTTFWRWGRRVFGLKKRRISWSLKFKLKNVLLRFWVLTQWPLTQSRMLRSWILWDRWSFVCKGRIRATFHRIF